MAVCQHNSSSSAVMEQLLLHRVLFLPPLIHRLLPEEPQQAVVKDIRHVLDSLLDAQRGDSAMRRHNQNHLQHGRVPDGGVLCPRGTLFVSVSTWREGFSPIKFLGFGTENLFSAFSWIDFFLK